MTLRTETWYTSDLHIGHRLVANLRGFAETTDHDAEIAGRWDRLVGDNDVVWVLGDISGGGRSSQLRALAWLADRPGTKHLVAGNHDGVHPMHVDAHKLLPAYLQTFASVQQSARRKLAGHYILLSHFPYLDADQQDVRDARFNQWKMADLGAWLLHGHIHSSRRLAGRTIHVGLDAWGLSPVSLNVIAELIQKDRTDVAGDN
nr:hypothetical protein RC58_14890 [Mycobacterium avium subsp. paratuberculosis]